MSLHFYPIPGKPKESRSRTESWLRIAKIFGTAKGKTHRFGDSVIRIYEYTPDPAIITPEFKNWVIRAVREAAKQQGILEVRLTQ